MNIAYAKMKKKISRSRFFKQQPARASLGQIMNVTRNLILCILIFFSVVQTDTNVSRNSEIRMKTKAVITTKPARIHSIKW